MPLRVGRACLLCLELRVPESCLCDLSACGYIALIGTLDKAHLNQHNEELHN